MLVAANVVNELVARAQQGDSQAFAELYERCAPNVFRFLRRRLDGPDQLVEDLTADVFVKTFQKLDRYVERGLPFTAWLYRLAYTTMVDYMRAQKGVYTAPLDDATEVAEQQAGSAFSRILDRQTLAPALACLTPEQRQVVELRFFASLGVAETATMMERSEEAVKKLQSRALVNLRRLLAPARGGSGGRDRSLEPGAWRRAS